MSEKNMILIFHSHLGKKAIEVSKCFEKNTLKLIS